MKKLFIKNRNNKKIAVIVEKNPKQIGLVFIMHGTGGFKEQKHIKSFAKAFWEKGLTAIRFDTRDTIGESEGKMENATITGYYQDLKDVIDWVRKQCWYQEPFYLIGHSLGGICVGLYAEKYPKKVKALAPISTVVSGKLSFQTYDKNELDEWKKTGWRIKESKSIPGMIKKLKWTHMEDRLKYNLLENSEKLTMPVLMIVGNNDDTTPLSQHKILFDKLPAKKELHIIKGAEHTFRDKKHLAEIKTIIKDWIDEVEK